MFSYLLNGPLTLVVVVVGSILNVCTIYVLSIYTLSKSRQQKQKLSNVTSILRSNESIRRRRQLGEGKEDGGRSAGTPCEGQDKESPRSIQEGCNKRPDANSFKSTQHSSRPRIYTFLLWLSVSDTALLISALLMYGIPALMHGRLQSAYVQFTAFYYLMSNAALTASVWLMCALTFDRYRTISRIFKRSSQSTSRINKALCVVSIMALAFSLPRFLEIRVEFDPESRAFYPTQTELVHSRFYMVGYRIIGGLLFYSLLPYIVLFLLSLKIWFVMREAASFKISSIRPLRLGRSLRSTANPIENGNNHRIIGHTNSDSSEMILISVIAKFLLSRLMPTALDAVEHIIGNEEFSQSRTLTFVVDVSNLMVVMSSAANFFIFYTLSRSFRRTSTECCCTKRKKLQREITGSRRHLRRTWSQISRRERATRKPTSDAKLRNGRNAPAGSEPTPFETIDN